MVAAETSRRTLHEAVKLNYRHARTSANVSRKCGINDLRGTIPFCAAKVGRGQRHKGAPLDCFPVDAYFFFACCVRQG